MLKGEGSAGVGERGRFWREREWIWGLFVLYFANGAAVLGLQKRRFAADLVVKE